MNTKLLKLDFNERSDSVPYWLDANAVNKQKLWSYPDKGLLVEAITKQLKVNKDQLLITNGGDEAIELLFKLAKLNNKQLVMPLPVFSQYWSGKDLWQLDTKLIEAQEDLTIDLDAALDAVKDGDILVLTSPNNPTGETLSIEQIEAAAQKVREKNAWLFLDQAYIEFTTDGISSLKLIEQFDNIILLRTLSKAYGLAGIRVGYLLASSKLIKKFSVLAMPFNVSNANLTIALQAFTESAKLEVQSYSRQIALNRELITNMLKDSGLSVIESQGNFVFVQGEPLKLQLIVAACNNNAIQIKDALVGLTASNKAIAAIRISIPFYLERLLQALRLALRPKLLCFDMDGVLIDTSKSYDQCIIETVKQVTGIVVEPEMILEARSRGGFNNDWKLTRQLIKELGTDISLDEVTSIFQDIYLGNKQKAGLCEQEQPLIEQSLINRLFNAKSKLLNTAVVTGRPKQEAIQGLEKLGLKNTILISDDDVSQSKPSPEGINKTKDFFQADTCWMFGDAPDDMQAAKFAGVLAIGIATSELIRSSLLNAGADIVLENINQLEVLI
ncbi:MAG: aminotransferase class I/II-fold pyridoxal phosphate-dependent enzyme [Kangiellaceae bacterium]|nr:aminotransferase class I/II-fold pyridoxal phosphate-dependent enzyme [Kangiellaceae bacterium]